jgi:hypothetical protein
LPEAIEITEASSSRQNFGSELFWKVLATVILFSVMWILWLLWQITPKSTVNPIVYQIQQNRQTATGTIQRAPDSGQTGNTSPTPEGQPSSAPTSVLSTGTPLKNLKIETELKTALRPTVIPAK